MKLERLGPYRILERIGKGGMGAVYVAAYEGPGEADGTRVAVKALSPQLAYAEGFRERFEAEIDSLKKLKHEGIVRLFGYGEQDGILFYSMELVEGTSLEEEINSGRRFNWHETLQIGIQICRALKHAHDHGVVHRDIKPANLLMTKDQQIKIADFGIARLFGGTQLTTAGGVLGTADYMSPEQADGRPVTEKCDQYSLGGVLYALLAGRPPFRAKTMPEMLQMQRFAEPEPVRRYAPETPPQLERLLSQLLSKNPEDRFPNVLVLARHMEAMDKALSRPEQVPTADQDVDAPAKSNKTLVSSKEHTQAGEHRLELVDEGKTYPPAPDLYDAPTLAQTPTASPPTDSDAAPQSVSKSSHFTTIDEEAKRMEQQRSAESWRTLLVQWAALLTLLGGFGWLVWWYMQPLTADDLYKRISSSIEDNGDEDLRHTGDEIEQFLRQFPEDSRADEIAELQERMELQKLERRAMARSRFMNPSKLPPIEQLYLEARETSETNPAQGRLMLQDMISLFDPQGLTQEGSSNSAANDASISTEDRRWLALARQQLARADREAQKMAAKQLPVLHDRMAEAERLRRSQPAAAAKMYRAIVRLYKSEIWAAELVNQATTRLAELEILEKQENSAAE